MIKSDPTKANLNIYQLDLITKNNQGFIVDVKSLMKFNNTDTSHMGIIKKQETKTKVSNIL